MNDLTVLGWAAFGTAVAAAGWWLYAAWVLRPASRVAGLGAPAEPAEEAAISRWLEALGGCVLRIAYGRAAALDPLRARAAGRALAVGVPAALLAGPLPALLLGGLLWWAPAAARRRRERERLAALAAEMPEVVDLFGLALGAGLNVSLAVAAVGRRATGRMGDELLAAAGEVQRGRRLGDALEAAAGRCGEATRPLLSLLAAGERYGVPLVDSLHRLAVDVRAAERRRVEELARRLPVKMLFPLVVCILPAFALLTLGPMLVTSLPSLTF